MSFDGRNIRAERSCLSDVNVLDLPSGVPSEIPEGTPVPSVQLAKLLINEVNTDNPGGGEDAEYIELFYTGQMCFSLQGYWLVLYSGKNSRAYRLLDLSGHHTDNLGYFLVGSSSMSPAPMIRMPPTAFRAGRMLWLSPTAHPAVCRHGCDSAGAAGCRAVLIPSASCSGCCCRAEHPVRE